MVHGVPLEQAEAKTKVKISTTLRTCGAIICRTRFNLVLLTFAQKTKKLLLILHHVLKFKRPKGMMKFFFHIFIHYPTFIFTQNLE